MTCTQTYISKTPLELSRTPFLYPAAGMQRSGRTIVEVGPGRGDFLFHLAEINPDATVVGIEIKRKRVDKLISRVEKRGLKNVSLIQDDARDALPRIFKDQSVDEIHMNFPDPWPKNKHAKNRAASREFLEECRRILKIGGTISIATDSLPYAQKILENAATIRGLQSSYANPLEREMPDAYPTFFAMKWRSEGREITYQKYRRMG
ncbi:MAG: tRNA (guanosine(46)-N7)-methyltransferase TrmB [Pseudomonadota bacterium]